MKLIKIPIYVSSLPLIILSLFLLLFLSLLYVKLKRKNKLGQNFLLSSERILTLFLLASIISELSNNLGLNKKRSSNSPALQKRR